MTTIWSVSVKGTNDHRAAERISDVQQFNHRPDVKFCVKGPATVFEQLGRYRDHVAVFPLEQGVTELMERVMVHWAHPDQKLAPFKIAFGVDIQQHHHLMSTRQTFSTDELKLLISEQRTFADCALALQQCGVRQPSQFVPSMIDAVQAACGSPQSHIGAIGSAFAAQEHDLILLKENLGRPHDIARFRSISQQQMKPTGKDTTALMFQAKRLNRALTALSETMNSMALTAVRTLAYREDSHGVYVEFSGHCTQSDTRDLIKRLGQTLENVTVLGSFPILTASN